MSTPLSSTLRPSSQPRDLLVLQVENVALAGRLLTIEIFEVQNRAGTPSIPHHSTPSTPSTPPSSTRTAGFRVTARDDVENEYSLFVTHQKAEYLHRVAYPSEADESDVINLEAMANGILAHLNIIGNRQRDVGKLVCREPVPHFEKKTRLLPVATPPHKQRNPHLPSKRQDQRAVRVQKTSKRTMEAVAQAMRRADLGLSGDDENEVETGKMDRKSSQASILHRMAATDSKIVWKAELETNYEEADHAPVVENATSTSEDTTQHYLAPGLSPVKRGLPDRKAKHRGLEERRQKGRQQHIAIAQATQEAPLLDYIQAQDSFSTLPETTQDLSFNGSRRNSMVSVSTLESQDSQPRASSAPRSSVGNAYGLRNLPEFDKQEPEQFLRRRTVDARRGSVLKDEHWPNDIPGMGIEITDERSPIQTPPSRLDALLNSARRVMMVNVARTPGQRSTGALKLVHDRELNRMSTSPTLGLYSAAVNAPLSSPILRSPKAEKSNNSELVEATAAVQAGTKAPVVLNEDSAGPQSNSEENVKPSPRPRSKSIGMVSLNPIPPLTIPQSVDTLDNKSPTHDQSTRLSSREDRSTPKSPILANVEADQAEMQSKVRPRSNSVGSEGVIRLAPLSSTATKPPVQEFLAPQESAAASVPTNANCPEVEVVQEEEVSVVPSDPEVVLYPPSDEATDVNEGVATAKSEVTVEDQPTVNNLSFRELQNDIRANESDNMPTMNTATADDEGSLQDKPNSSQQISPAIFEDDVISPPSARKGCWEEPDLVILLSEAHEKATEDLLGTAAPMKASPTESDIDYGAHEEQSDSVISIPFQQHAPSLKDCASVTPQVDPIRLQGLDEGTKTDEQSQGGETPSQLSGERSEASNCDSEVQRDLDTDIQTGTNDTLADSDAVPGYATPDIIDSAECVVNEIEEVKGVVDIVGGFGGESTETSYCNAVGALVNTGELELIDQDNCATKAQNSPDISKDQGDVSMTYSARDSEVEITASSPDSDEVISAQKTQESSENDELLLSDSRVSSFHPAKVFPYEEPVSRKPTYEDSGVTREDNPDQVTSINFAEELQPTPDSEVIPTDQLTIAQLTPSDNKVRRDTASPLARKKQPTVSSIQEREKPSGVSRKKSLSPNKKPGPPYNTGPTKTTSKVTGSRRRSSIAETHPKVGRRHSAEDLTEGDLPSDVQRTSTIEQSKVLPGVTPPSAGKAVAKVPAEKNLSPALRHNSTSKRQEPVKRHSSQQAGVAQSVTNYHKKWGRWMLGKSIIEKVGCLQLEELVITDPRNEENLLKLGLRYARTSGTSMAAISLLEHAALLHKTAAGTHEYWFWLGSAHLNIFMRHRKYLPVARFHLGKSIRAFASAFAYIESLADPVLLLRYALGLFWYKGDGNLEKTRDIFHELFSQFVGFCDKGRPNLLFLQFQVLHRLKLYVDAIDCMNAILALQEDQPYQPAPTGMPILSSANAMPSSADYDAADYRLMLMQCQQVSGDYVAAAQSLASVLKLKSMQQDTTLRDEQYFDLWYSLAERCFHHEDYALALEYYAIAINFAKQSQVLAAIHYNLGLCFQSLGEDNKCMTEYKRGRTTNRHVPPMVPLAELSTSYEERFLLLLQKSVAQMIEEVRVELYGKAVRRLQRVFKSRQSLKIDIDSNNSGNTSTKMPSLLNRRSSSIAAARKSLTLAKTEDTIEETDVIKDESLPQNVAAVADNQASKVDDNSLECAEQRHEDFLARKQAAIEEMAELLTNPQYQGREASPSSRSNARLKPTSQIRSGLLSPEKDRLDARRQQSMDTFRQLGYVSSTMPWIEFWEKLLALALEIYESRQALYGSIARIRGRLPLVTDEVAFCALAESIGNVHEAAEKLHDASYERELTYVCAVIEVSKQLERYFPLDPTRSPLKAPHVLLPTISSPTADTIAAHSSTSPVGTTISRRVVLPPYSPTRSTPASNSVPGKHLRMNEMLNLQFNEHVQKQDAAIAIAEATGGVVQRKEKLLVIQNFRQANDVLLSSQLAFGGGKAAR